jgi:hypothetical protein
VCLNGNNSEVLFPREKQSAAMSIVLAERFIVQTA